ncbi:hypothetical protein [Pseudidiomarina aquimaris]|uniref:hypothetical protein n=1 Tax=Pseudidiomarina aquimaris TaxID=641841 RepID=UPI003A969CD8
MKWFGRNCLKWRWRAKAIVGYEKALRMRVVKRGGIDAASANDLDVLIAPTVSPAAIDFSNGDHHGFCERAAAVAGYPHHGADGLITTCQ